MTTPAPTTFIAVIDLWPKRAGLARLVGIKPTLVRAWHARNSIPEPYWMKVAEAAERCGFPGVTYATLSRFTPGF